MKLYLKFCIALLLFGTALSGPLDGYLRTNQAFERAGAQRFPNFANVQGYPTYNLNQPVVQNLLPETEENAGADYINEVKDQVQAPKSNGDEAELQAFKYFKSVKQGSTVALQPLYQKQQWLGCSTNPCSKATCPNMYMEGSDWTNCWGEVFQIWRAHGRGSIEVGDVVGLYYPRERKWFSTYSGEGTVQPCPGTPTYTHGFANDELWYSCWGEVFKIYARGKSLGATIEDHDEILLYYIHDHKWVSLHKNSVSIETCPGSTRPPPPERYEQCWGENFEFWLK